MQKFKWFLMLGIFAAPFILQGQADTVFLETVEIAAPKIRNLSLGGQIIHWNKKDLATTNSDNLAELLESEAGVFIKSYGLNSLATSSVRGGSAGHTLVLWNGLPVQSPMLGLLDLSLIPLNGLESIRLEKGGSSALWGSGAIGAVIALNNRGDFSNKISLQAQTKVGSFGEYFQQVGFGLGNQNIQSSTRFSLHRADNDFFYTVGADLPKRQQTNAHFLQYNFLQDFYWKIKSNQLLSIHFWRQDSDRQIPPTNVQNFSKAHQDDASTRLIVDWQRIKKRSVIQAKIGGSQEHQDYYDDATGLEANNDFTTLTAELDGQWSFKKQQRVYLGMTQTFTKAESASYQGNTVENKSALFASYRLDRPKFQLQTSIRQALVDGNRVPLVPVLGFSVQLSKPFQLKGKISRNYRLPTLNDRYWNPGGNKNLLPESGWSEELTLATNTIFGKSKMEISLTSFNRKINQWILWSRLEGQPFWSANNITKVWSRGVEPRFSYHFQNKKFQLKLNIGYDYIRSTNEVALETPRIPKGAQLIYTPKHKAFASIRIDWKKLKLIYQHQYNGASQGINGSLEDFQTGSLRMQYAWHKNKHDINLFVNLNNIWDTDYLIIERRPMPGRNFQFGLNYLFKKP